MEVWIQNYTQNQSGKIPPTVEMTSLEISITIQNEALWCVCGLHMPLCTPYNIQASVWEKCD